METLILILTVGFVCLSCFIVGAKVGQTVAKGERVELPNLNPMDAIRAHQEKQQAKATQERIDTILNNIECYDGTSKGQEDVPRG